MKKLIDKYIDRIKKDYPEDDKLMIDLQDFANEYHTEQLRLGVVVRQSEQLNCDHDWKYDTFDVYGFPVKKYCDKCDKEETI